MLSMAIPDLGCKILQFEVNSREQNTIGVILTMLRLFFLPFFLISNFILAADLESQGNSEAQKLIEELPMDYDLKEKLWALSLKSVDEIEYNEVADVLNEQQKRCSSHFGVIVAVTQERMVYLHDCDEELLKAFYYKDQDKLKKAESYWNWHRRAGAIGLPPQLSVPLKKSIVYAGCIMTIGGIYYFY